MDASDLARAVTAVRRYYGWTRADVASMADGDEWMVEAVEAGNLGRLTVRQVVAIADVLDIEVMFVLTPLDSAPDALPVEPPPGTTDTLPPDPRAARLLRRTIRPTNTSHGHHRRW